MADDTVSRIQRLLDDANKKAYDATARSQRASLALQSEIATIMSQSDEARKRVEREIDTLKRNLDAMMSDISHYQEEQAQLNKKLQESLKKQNEIQKKHTEQQARISDYTQKLTSIQREQDTKIQGVRSRITRDIEAADREAAQARRGVGTLQADLARALANQQRERLANDNSKPGASRGYGNLR